MRMAGQHILQVQKKCDGNIQVLTKILFRVEKSLLICSLAGFVVNLLMILLGLAVRGDKK